MKSTDAPFVFGKTMEIGVLWERFCAMPQLMMDHSLRVGVAVRVLLNAANAQADASDAVDEDLLGYAAAWHDIGKSLIPCALLQKKTPLRHAEWALMRSHTQFGAEMLSDLFARLPGDATVLKAQKTLTDVALYHHEWWDGSGYPQGKRGEEIPYMARVVAVADSVEAMYNPRTYSARKSPETIETILSEGSGTQFDPAVVALFSTAKKNVFDAIRRPGADLQRSFYAAFQQMWNGDADRRKGQFVHGLSHRSAVGMA